MKKFEIKNTRPGQWLVIHNEMPKFTCSFEDKRFHYERTITGLSNPEGEPKEVPANTENGKVAQGVS